MPAVVPVSLRTRAEAAPAADLSRLVREALDAGAGMVDILRLNPTRGPHGGWFIEISVQVAGAGVRPGNRQHLRHPAWFTATSGGAWWAARVTGWHRAEQAATALRAAVDGSPQGQEAARNLAASRAADAARAAELAAESRAEAAARAAFAPRIAEITALAPHAPVFRWRVEQSGGTWRADARWMGDGPDAEVTLRLTPGGGVTETWGWGRAPDWRVQG